MRKFISTLLAGVILSGFSLALSGCTEESSTKEETKVTTPQGTTTESRQVKVDKSGKNPPSAPSEKPNP